MPAPSQFQDAVIASGLSGTGIPDTMTGDLTFPHNLPEYKYYITFDFRKWVRRPLAAAGASNPFYKAEGNLRLPIPHNMIDNQAVRWGEDGSNPIVGALVDNIAKGKGLSGDAQQTMREQIDRRITGIGGDLFAGGAAAALQAIVGQQNINQGGTLLGMAINPYLTVFFQSPTFKRHVFSWRLAPNTSAESETLVNMIAKFRFHMLPKRNQYAGGTLLDYPDICFITLNPRDRMLYKFKPCVIEDLQINFAPNSPAFFGSTEAPAEINITLNLLEIEYWLKEDVRDSWNVDTTAIAPR